MCDLRELAHKTLDRVSLPMSCDAIIDKATNGLLPDNESIVLSDLLYKTLLCDVNFYKSESLFLQLGPRVFDINPQYRGMYNVFSGQLYASTSTDSTLKNNVLEQYICNLINLYGNQTIFSKKIAEFDTGIELLVEGNKDSAELFGKCMYLSVQGGFGTSSDWYSTIVDVRSLPYDEKHFQLFCYYNVEIAELDAFMWLVPSTEFRDITSEIFTYENVSCYFSGGLQNQQSIVWEPHLMHKRDLAQTIISRLKMLL